MRRLFGIVSIALVAIIAPLGAVASGPLVRQGQPAPTPRLELVQQRFAIEADGTIELQYRLTGVTEDALEFLPPEPEPTVPPATTPDVDGVPSDTDEPEPPVELTIEITNYAPLTDVAEAADVIGSDVDPDAFSGVIDGVAISNVRNLASVDPDGSIIIDLEIATDVERSVEERLQFERPGLYPLRTELLVGDPRDDDVVATAGTIVQRLAGPDDPGAPTAIRPPPIDLSVITVIPAPGPDATPVEVARAERVFDDALMLADGLDAPVTIEVPPQLVADATATPVDAERVASALDGDELVALPILPLDVSSAVAAGRDEAFARLLTAGEDLLTTAVPTTPSRRDVWITTDALSGSGAQELRDLGVRYVVMPADVYRETVGSTLPATDLFVESELPDGGDLPLLVVDPREEQLTSAAATEILADTTTAEWAVETIVDLLLEQQADDRSAVAAGAALPERSVVLTTPDLSPPDLRLLAGLERLAATTPSIRFAPASELIGVTDVQIDNGSPVTVRLPNLAGPSLIERVQLIDSTALKMLSAASMLAEDDPRPPQWGAELDRLISTGYSDAEVRAATAELVAGADELKESVVLPEPFTFTLTGRSGPIEIRLGNTSDETLEVRVGLDSPKVDFPDGDQIVQLRPNDETSVIVPVEARSNGTSSIELSVSTPAGELLGEPVALTSRVTGFTGLGQVLMGGLILVLLTWWFTHWRARRREATVGQVRQRHPTASEVGSDAL